MASVSILIPVHVRTKFLQEAIDSMSNQTRKADKLIVVFDKDTNIPTSRNRDYDSVLSSVSSIEKLNDVQISTDALVVLCEDDKLKPDFLAKTLNKMHETNADIVYTDFEIFGLAKGIAHMGDWETGDWYKETQVPVTALIKTEVWKKYGGYKDVPIFDWDFYWTCQQNGCTAYHIPEPLFMYRTHPDQDARRLDRYLGGGAGGLNRIEKLVRSRHEQ